MQWALCLAGASALFLACTVVADTSVGQASSERRLSHNPGGTAVPAVETQARRLCHNSEAASGVEEPPSATQQGPSSQTPSYRPPAYHKADSWREVDVEFGDIPWRVKGKLSLPRTRALAPAVVLVHGSGPQDEDETIGPNKPFRDLAGGLASNGIAVLRYQKRTFAHRLRLAAKGNITVREEVIDDALAAVEFLRGRAGIEKSRIYVLGHSLGGTLAPQIATEDKKLAGAILLASSGRDFFEVLEDQLAYICSLPGPGREGNQKVHKEIRQAVAGLRAGGDPREIHILGVPAAYWNELNDYGRRSLGLAKQLECRLFIAGGGRDYQITKKDYDLYRKVLKGRKTVTFRWYKNLNHLFMPGEAKATPAEYARVGHVDEKLISDLVEWINRG